MAVSNRAPYIELRSFTEVSPDTSPDREVFLVGHTKTGTTLQNGLAHYIPNRIGQMRSQEEAVALATNFGMSVSFKDPVTLDLANTDELAAMMVTAAQQFDQFIPQSPRHVLQPCNFTLIALEDDTTNQPSSQSFDDGAGTDALSNARNLTCDLFVCPYELVNSAIGGTGNFYDVLTTWMDSRIADNDISLGQNWILFSNVTETSSTLTESGYEYSTNINFPVTNSYFQPSAAIVGANMAVQMQGMIPPFYGRFEVAIPNLPSPQSSEIIDQTEADALFAIGWSPLMTNRRSGAVFSSRFVSGQVTDPVTGIQRNFYYDYQSYLAFFLSQVRLKAALQARNIINDKFTVNSSGEAPVLRKARKAAIEVDTGMFDEQMVAVDPALYKNEYSAKIDGDNPNLIRFKKPFYPTPIVYQIIGTTTVRNSVPLIKQFNIVV
jgi:hypothetical protein